MASAPVPTSSPGRPSQFFSQQYDPPSGPCADTEALRPATMKPGLAAQNMPAAARREAERAYNAYKRAQAAEGLAGDSGVITGLDLADRNQVTSARTQPHSLSPYAGFG